VYRKSDDKVGFLELNPVTAKLLEELGDNAAQKNGEAILRSLAAEIGYADVDALIQHGETALEEMRELEIVIGSKAPS